MIDAHTPGPWITSPFSSVVGCVITAQPNPARNAIRVAGVGGAETREAVIANARLIAAAPDLLLALKAMTEEWVDYMTINNLGDPWAKHNMKLASAAIAAAEGH